MTDLVTIDGPCPTVFHLKKYRRFHGSLPFSALPITSYFDIVFSFTHLSSSSMFKDCD